MKNQYLLSTFFYENQYLSVGKINFSSKKYYPILSFFLFTHLVFHLPVTGKIYLHDGNVFALDICLDLYLQPFHLSNDLFSAFCQNPYMIMLVFLMLIMFSAFRPTVRSVCLCVLHFLALIFLIK